jgi:bifunctional DNA-binding transcriptional regulator/antitoxin component of YhaV-PrlF toxin-antitoxin module
LLRINRHFLQTIPEDKFSNEERRYMKATGIVRRVDDLGRIVIPKEIRRTLKIREGDPSYTTLTPFDKFCIAIHSVVERYKAR